MREILKDVRQTAVQTGERALRLIWELANVASERLRANRETMPPPQSYVPPPSPPAPAPRPAPTAAAAPTPAPAPAPAAKPKAKRAATGKKKRPDQLLRVLDLLNSAGAGWLSAKELSQAGEAAGKPILPGNVRKVIRGRGGDFIETRPRVGNRRGALEYRITKVGLDKLGA